MSMLLSYQCAFALLSVHTQGDVPVVEADLVVEEVKLPISGRGAGPVVLCMAPAESSAVTLADPPASADDSAHASSNGSSTTQYSAMQSTDENVDSRRYVREVINLSVELDSAEVGHRSRRAPLT